MIKFKTLIQDTTWFPEFCIENRKLIDTLCKYGKTKKKPLRLLLDEAVSGFLNNRIYFIDFIPIPTIYNTGWQKWSNKMQ